MKPGDIWEDHIGRRTIIAVYDRDVLVAWEAFSGPRDLLTLPKRLFTEGRCGQPVTVPVHS